MKTFSSVWIAGALLTLACAKLFSAADPSTVLVLVNDAYPAEAGTGGVGASVYVGQHYAQVRGIPVQNVLHLNIPLDHMQWLPTNDFMQYADYLTDIQTPVQTYLSQNGLTNKILYIVPTYGIPYMLQSLPGDPAQTWRISLDSVLAGMNSGKTVTQTSNPYHTTSVSDSPLHFKDWTNPSGWKMYLVTRLDGPSALIAAGLVDKAVSAESSLQKTDGVGYYDWQHRTNPADPDKYTDDTVLAAYNEGVSAGIPSRLNDQSVTGGMFSAASYYQFNGSSVAIFTEGHNPLTASFMLPSSTNAGLFNTTLNFKLDNGLVGAGATRFRLYSSDLRSYWELTYPWPSWAFGPVVLNKVVQGSTVATCSVTVSTIPMATDVAFTFSDSAGAVSKNGVTLCSLTDSSASRIDVTQGEVRFDKMTADWTGISVRDAASNVLWNDTFSSDPTGRYTWITAPKEAPNALFVWGWYSGVHDAYTVVNGAVGTQMNSYTANYIRSNGIPEEDWQWVPYFLRQGITATWGATGEPYTTGYANADNLFGHFWRGYNFAESAYLAAPSLNWMMVFIGDPLYSPVAFNGSSASQVPPSIVLQPTDATVSVGQTAAFSVTANGTAPLLYQWYENGSPIAGATGSSYKTPATTLSDDGAQFYVVVTNVTAQPVTSGTATLHVNALQNAAAPTITPNGGSFNGPVVVTLADSTPGAQIYYAFLGLSPITVYLRYSTPITLQTSGTLLVYATASEMNSSSLATAQFTIGSQPPSQPSIVTSIAVTPSGTTTVPTNGTQLFTATAYDQLGNTFSPPPVFSWLVPAPAGTISTSGLFTAANAAGGPFSLTASAGGVTSPAVQVMISSVTAPLPPPISDPLPTPDLSAINGKTFALTDTIAIAYPGNATGFNWQFTDAPTSVAGNRLIASLETAGSAGTQTASPQLNLAAVSVSAGSYAVQVQAFNSSQQSNWARGTLTLVATDFSGVRVYPNPWRPDRGYSKAIIFDQLTANAALKIFTVSGRLVKKLSTAQSSITWDLTNESGDAVAAGLYLYLITDSQGQQSRGKFVIIR